MDVNNLDGQGQDNAVETNNLQQGVSENNTENTLNQETNIENNTSATKTTEQNTENNLQVEVPEDISEYGLSDLLKNQDGEQILTIEDSALEFFGNKFKELGFPKDKAQDLFKSYVEYGIKEFHQFTNADELETNVNKMFNGNKVQRTTCENLIKEFLSKEDLSIVQNSVPNVVVEMFYKVTKGLVDKYGYKESSTLSNKPLVNRMTQADRDNEYEKIVKELEELEKRPHSTQEKENLMSKLMKVYE